MHLLRYLAHYLVARGTWTVLTRDGVGPIVLIGAGALVALFVYVYRSRR